MSAKRIVRLSVNGEEHEVPAAPWHTLLEVLRDRLNLPGTKCGCNQGLCGSCTVLKDGQPVRACLALAVNSTGCEITTIEGLADGNQPSTLQRAFVEAGAIQCGFCTAGLIVQATALLAGNPNPSVDEIREGLSGNLCRCTGYVKVIDAVKLAAERMNG